MLPYLKAVAALVAGVVWFAFTGPEGLTGEELAAALSGAGIVWVVPNVPKVRRQ